MLGIAGLGIAAGTVRAVLLEGAGGWSWLLSAVWLLLPVAVIAAFCLGLSRRSPVAALGGGVATALVAALYTFELLHPKYNGDANIGLGLYLTFGWLFPLGPAALLGSLVGAGVERLRGGPPTPAAPADAPPLPPLRPWLWPLLVPGVVSLAVSLRPLFPLWRQEQLGAQEAFGLLLSFGMTALGVLAVSLSPALMALPLLRSRAARDGVLRPRLAAFRGLCLGLAVTLGLFGFGQGLLRAVPLGIFLLLCAAFPFLGYAVGRHPKG
ncbi:hypothetical protein DEIPH_ctg044orf0047 [Deinococcus phoenicis]|uniref:Uncharacterized protein n=2 Tax=Deinococcus phoenicis TaxID=1476583 RepID=A0A016QN54_9DEIO|nr:hypothetical protein DEIPH_ctg044orf0047 [Deinococcus phoenicis]